MHASASSFVSVLLSLDEDDINQVDHVFRETHIQSSYRRLCVETGDCGVLHLLASVCVLLVSKDKSLSVRAWSCAPEHHCLELPEVYDLAHQHVHAWHCIPAFAYIINACSLPITCYRHSLAELVCVDMFADIKSGIWVTLMNSFQTVKSEWIVVSPGVMKSEFFVSSFRLVCWKQECYILRDLVLTVCVSKRCSAWYLIGLWCVTARKEIHSLPCVDLGKAMRSVSLESYNYVSPARLANLTCEH